MSIHTHTYTMTYSLQQSVPGGFFAVLLRTNATSGAVCLILHGFTRPRKHWPELKLDRMHFICGHGWQRDDPNGSHHGRCERLGPCPQSFYAECYLPRSAQSGLRTGSSSVHCAWRAHGLHRGAAFAPPRRVQRAQVRQNGSWGGSLISG